MREVRVTEAEWNAAIAFLTAAGHITDDKRQARLNTIRHIIKSIDCPETDKALAVPDETIVLQATKKTIAALHR